MRLRAAAERAGRNPDAIGLVAVTKYASLKDIRELLESGQIAEIGESRVSDALAKREALGAAAAKVAWRLIGHLQSNKARRALEAFDAIDSIDGLRLARILEGELAAAGRELPVLVQVKLTGKTVQSGAAPEELGPLLEGLKAFPHLRVRGLMAIAPDLEPVSAVRPHFRRMKQLFDKFFAGSGDAQLSMGMSRDFEVAVEEGATHVRVGSALFS